MKFTDLSGNQRSMLTMLCTGQTFTTIELARGCNPRADAQSAAQLLMDLREKGVAFSSQKPAGQPYANWRASDYGRDVFAGRPDDVVSTNVAKAPTGRTPGLDEGTPLSGTWIVYYGNEYSSSKFIHQYKTEAEALEFATAQTNKHGAEYHVAKLVARVKPVQQPTFEIERV